MLNILDKFTRQTRCFSSSSSSFSSKTTNLFFFFDFQTQIPKIFFYYFGNFISNFVNIHFARSHEVNKLNRRQIRPLFATPTQLVSNWAQSSYFEGKIIPVVKGCEVVVFFNNFYPFLITYLINFYKLKFLDVFIGILN